MINGRGGLRPSPTLGGSMQIIIEIPCHVRGVPRTSGDVIEVSEAEAKQYLSSGHAIKFEVKQKKTLKKAVEKVIKR